MTESLSTYSLIETKAVGADTTIGAYSHIFPAARIGANCRIGEHVLIENDVIIGNRVTIHGGVQLWDGITVEDDVFIGPNATFTNDIRTDGKPSALSKRAVLRSGATIGANATLLPGIVVGMNAVVGAGSVVTHDVPPYAKVVGNPARIIGYTKSHAKITAAEDTSDGAVGSASTSVKGVTICEMPLVKDLRGDLSVGEFERSVPFPAKRYFLVFGVPNGKVRGEHAHKECHQFLICIKGACAVVADDGANRVEVELDRPNKGIYLPPMTWGVQYKYTPDAVLLVFASHYYDAADYIRDYDSFLKALRAR